MVSYAPECESVGVGEVFADASDLDVVFTCAEEWHGVFVFVGVVDEFDAFSVEECFAYVGEVEWLFSFDPDAFAMGA